MAKTGLILRSLAISSVFLLILGSAAAEVQGQNASEKNGGDKFSGSVLPIGSYQGQALFSGQILSMALNPRPEPPIYQIGEKMAKGIFSGQIVLSALNPQPEPPAE
jgi:hypothetical protein